MCLAIVTSSNSLILHCNIQDPHLKSGFLWFTVVILPNGNSNSM